MDKTGSLLGLIGLVCIVVGLWWAWPPLAMLMGGAVLVLAAVSLETPSRSTRTEADQAPTEWNEAL